MQKAKKNEYESNTMQNARLELSKSFALNRNTVVREEWSDGEDITVQGLQ